MNPTEPNRYIAYLKAKKSVDDRALNRHVWQTLKESLAGGNPRRPLQVVELGAGIGTMLDRIGQWELTDRFDYTMVEINPAYLDAFRSGESRRSTDPSATVAWQDENHARVSFGTAAGTVATVCADLNDYVSATTRRGRFDLAIAHAVMDIVDIETTLAGIRQVVKPGGLVYLSLNYDGWTCLLPPVDSSFEQILFDRYHRSMDQRVVGGRPSGASRTGRLLFAGLQRLRMPILAAGGSDWIVYPRQGRYSEDETFFLEMILHTVDRQLRQDGSLDQRRLAAWVTERCAQIDAARLILMARNIDFLAAVGP